ncbi:unnamed protein product [Lymnaea stagnalis]|uniref:Fucosyltransferase n=1 Tax=Lymnaea stagnalis TaxID=6523 RepID=A0AAV2H609_LYMST
MSEGITILIKSWYGSLPRKGLVFLGVLTFGAVAFFFSGSIDLIPKAYFRLYDPIALGNVSDGNVSEKNSKWETNATDADDDHWSDNRTYDSSINAQCKRSPFMFCSAEQKGDEAHPFHVGLLRRPAWMPEKIDFSRCKYSNCEFHGTNINEETDFVVLYVVGIDDSYSPPKRWPHQLYGAFTMESPPHTRASFLKHSPSVWNYAINVTITYRTDADIFTPYGRLRFQPTPHKDRPNCYDIARNKTRTAAWFVSNCRTPSKRDKYVKEMQKYIDVDIFGGCGQPCSRNGTDCFAELPREYKFYLSFENSLCTDYITEKFFKLFAPSMHIIPVVRGGAKYEKYFPKNTFINAANFTSAKELALYLKTLAGDLNAYSKLLEHKDMFKTLNDIENSVGCQVCALLNTKKDFRKIYDMKAWMGDGHCFEPRDLPSG